MEQVFDTGLVERNRLKALAGARPGVDFLLKLAAEEMADRLAVVEREFPQAVELYGATGVVADSVMATGKVGAMLRVDTDAAFARNGEAFEQAPFEFPDLEAQSANLVLAPLSAHLTNDTPGFFIQARRALKPDGLFLAAIPGSGTLGELRECLLAAEAEIYGGASPRVIPFADVRDIGGLLQRAGFALPVVDQENYTVRYDTLFNLMADLKAMGMANPLADRPKRPVSRAFFLRAAELYAERFSDPDGRIRATFSIIHVSGWAPHESQQQPLKPGSAKARLADALNTEEIKLKR
ncbi:SAM-dependent methyltransferase [Martelella endophytica]|uniref:SAM-dependent methyltransferase n=1 Tax=Martelella endophytica TaxID=1486262 RepID=A0A0D5LXD5_MAREN|nr:SAM-dependent methyltransferase [Martelella endophytica]AJY48103.1 SAM-dependent methyltransferase [Martelella endophytica]